MSVLKIRDENGVVHEIFALKGEKGDPGSGGDASQITYDGSEQYIQATTVEEALHATSDHILNLHMEVSGKANEFHNHNANEIHYVAADLGIASVDEALSYLLGQVGSVSAAFDELHAYAQALVNGGDTE